MVSVPAMVAAVMSVPAMVAVHTVEHSDLLRREDLSPLDLHLGLFVHELDLEAVQLLLLREKGRVVRLGISEELPYLDPLHLDVVPEIVGIGPEVLTELLHLSLLHLSLFLSNNSAEMYPVTNV